MWQVNTQLIDYLPTWFKEIVEFQQICETEEQQLEALSLALYTIADNFFFQTMDASAIEQWEQIFGIVASSSESLEFRRTRLLNRMSMSPPFTLAFLYQKLDELIGAGNWEVTVDYSNYTIYVLTDIGNQDFAQELTYTIGKIKPAHIVFYNSPYIRKIINLISEVDLAELVWNYKLGVWGLGLLPFVSTVTKGVVVVASPYSIQDELLNDTASAISANVNSARINGSIIISTLIKTLSDNVAEITYTVTPADTAVVTQIELLDSDGNVLTSSPVYVPITDNTVITHKIYVQAGEAS